MNFGMKQGRAIYTNTHGNNMKKSITIPYIEPRVMRISIIQLAIIFIFVFKFIPCRAQQQLITNGGFEISPWFTGWSTVNPQGACWAGNGYCSAAQGQNHMWIGDQYEQSGINSVSEDIYQSVNIPVGSSSCTLSFQFSATTNEFTSISMYDYFYVRIRNGSNQLLSTLYTFSNLDALQGIPTCANWTYLSIPIPTSYFGQNIRISFESTLDISNPTIFRLDDVSILATQNCNYTVSSNTYSCPSELANNYSNIANISAPTGCSWTANVTSGSSWLSTVSSGSGNGTLNISVTQNTSTSSRSGVISIAGNNITIVQPGINCSYTLSQFF